MIGRHIKSLGIELECGMNHPEILKLEKWIITNKVRSYFDYGSDGSISVPNKDVRDIEFRFWHTDLAVIKSFLKAAYGSGAQSNESCGFHVHVVFDDYALLTFKPCFSKFLQMYRKHYATSRKYIKRLGNHYCKAKGITEDSISGIISGDYLCASRYYAINFVSLGENNNGTVEFRIFPYQSTYEEASETLNWLVNTIDIIFETEYRTICKREIIIGALSNRTDPTNAVKIDIDNVTPSRISITYNKFVHKSPPIHQQLQTFGSLFTVVSSMKPSKSSKLSLSRPPHVRN